jgi:hypothetical protein
MEYKTWLCIIIVQILSTLPACAEEADVLSDLSKSHPGWVLCGHFYVPSGKPATTKDKEALEFRQFGSSVNGAIDLQVPTGDGQWEMPDGFAGWAAF